MLKRAINWLLNDEIGSWVALIVYFGAPLVVAAFSVPTAVLVGLVLWLGIPLLFGVLGLVINVYCALTGKPYEVDTRRGRRTRW